MEKMLWLIGYVKSSLQSFMLEISCSMMLPSQVEQLKLIAIKSQAQPILYHTGDSEHA